jgi:MtN3 and saliva related transmembrane protein
MDYITSIGIAAGTLTTISFFPQAVKIIRTRNTKSISLAMYIILFSGISLWTIYGIIIKDVPVVLANAVTLFPALVILIMKIRYK